MYNSRYGNEKAKLVSVFEDTESWYQENETLKDTVKSSIEHTEIYKEGETPDLPPARERKAYIDVNKMKTLECAYDIHRKHPNMKICIHNFASATHPGGGVRRGSRAQEECLCRTTTLLPVLETKKNDKEFYSFHKQKHNPLYTDACIYTPGIMAVKTDDDVPKRLPEEQWMKLDVLTCAAPNLRVMERKVPDAELQKLHEKRARHLLSVAATHGEDAIVLGAFGCGAFKNSPYVVAKAYANVLPDFLHQFDLIAFAIYCTPRSRDNYVAFYNTLNKLKR